MDKRNLHHLLTRVRTVKVMYLAVPLVLTSAISVIALRENNLGMVRLRDNVYAVDQQGGDVEAALQKLRGYVYGHMNTELSTGTGAVYPPVQLKYTYQRLQQAEKDRVKADNAKIYTQAQAQCEAENPSGFSGSGRIPCIEAYVSSHGVTEKKIPDAMYKFNFTSPTWSPDVAGFGILISIALALFLFLRIATAIVLKNLTK